MTTLDRQPGPTRVLMVVRLFHPWVGGTERQAQKLAQALRETGVDVRVVTGWWFRGTRRQEVIDGVPVFRNQTLWEAFGIRGLRKFGGYLYIVSLAWHLWRRRDRYDVVHVHGLNYHTFAAVLACRLARKPVVTKLANSGPASDIAKMREDRQLKLARFMLPTALRCDRFVALNTEVVAELRAAGVPDPRIVELPNGVETTPSPRSSYDLKRPPRIVYVGRLHAQKQLEILLHAVASLRQREPYGSLVLRLVGDGPERRALTALARGLDLGSHVEFVGMQRDVAPHLDEADVFVLPSRAEGLSNALLEAMAAGLPVVVSDIPGNRDVVRHGVNGLRFTADRPDELTATLESVLGDAGLRRSLGEAARRTVEETFGLQSVAGRYVELYRSLSDAAALAGRAVTPPQEMVR